MKQRRLTIVIDADEDVLLCGRCRFQSTGGHDWTKDIIRCTNEAFWIEGVDPKTNGIRLPQCIEAEA